MDRRTNNDRELTLDPCRSTPIIRSDYMSQASFGKEV